MAARTLAMAFSMSGVRTTGPPWAPWLWAEAALGWTAAVGDEVSLSQAAKATIATAATAAAARDRGNVSGGMSLSSWGTGAAGPPACPR